MPQDIYLSSYLYVSGQREIFSERVSLEAVIGQDTSQVRMVSKKHTIHVPDFSFIPVSSLENFITRINWSQFICVAFDSDPGVVTKR